MSSFSSKILLFGEYGIIKGSRGLAIPFTPFYGSLEIKDGYTEKSLKDFAKNLRRSSILNKEINLGKLDSDLETGLFFKSNIPQGMGLGSSGALCAAIFSKYSCNYSRETIRPSDLAFVQEVLSLMESTFHGTSSGLDPLISYMNKPLLITSGNKVEIVSIPNLSEFGHFYLLDTKINRKTSPLVHQFLKDCSDEKYFSGIEKYMNLTDLIIDNFQNSMVDNFIDNFKEISRLQYLSFDDMIPKALKSLWLAGLESKDYYLKLCGAGGGGYFLVFSKYGKVPFDHSLIKLNS
jgi:mevalonate kinase